MTFKERITAAPSFKGKYIFCSPVDAGFCLWGSATKRFECGHLKHALKCCLFSPSREWVKGFYSGPVLPRKKVMPNCSLPREELGKEELSGKAAWAQPARSSHHRQPRISWENLFPPSSCWAQTLSIPVLGMAWKSQLISSLPTNPGYLRPIWFYIYKVLYLIKFRPSASSIRSKVWNSWLILL